MAVRNSALGSMIIYTIFLSFNCEDRNKEDTHMVNQNTPVDKKLDWKIGRFYFTRSIAKLEELREEIMKLYRLPLDKLYDKKILAEMADFVDTLSRCEKIVLTHSMTKKYFQNLGSR